jgi:hypothetical protein
MRTNLLLVLNLYSIRESLISGFLKSNEMLKQVQHCVGIGLKGKYKKGTQSFLNSNSGLHQMLERTLAGF